jgi:hypothetical protein
MNEVFNILTFYLVLFYGTQEINKKEFYEKVIKNYDIKLINLSNPEYLDKLELKDKKTGKSIKVKELKPLEKNLFYLFMMEKLSLDLKATNDLWQENLKNIPKETKEKEATKEDVEKYIKEIFKIRKKTAEKFEKLMEEIFKEFENDIPKEERELYNKKWKNFHDCENLK